jgi:hypothetical protein
MIRLKEERFSHRRSIKMALTCGEEPLPLSTAPIILPRMSGN